MKGVIIIGRNPRVEFAGACYHVIQRGINQEAIFRQDREKRFFLERLSLAAVKYDWLILGYVVMNNHYHLLVQIKNDSLAAIMHQLNGRYAQYYNWLHRREGYVFQGRYKAYLIKDDLHLLTVLRYIHQNPLRAKIAKHISEYRWCSDYDYRSPVNGWVHSDLVLNMLSVNRAQAVLEYRRLVGELVTEKEKETIYQKVALEEIETESGQETATSLSGAREMPPPHGVHRELNSLDEILRQCCINEGEFQMIKNGSRSRQLRDKKLAYIKRAREANYSITEIAANISLTRTAISHYLKIL